jgi:hypothetical protein
VSPVRQSICLEKSDLLKKNAKRLVHEVLSDITVSWKLYHNPSYDFLLS